MKKKDSIYKWKSMYIKILLVIALSGVIALLIVYLVPENSWVSSKIKVPEGDRHIRLALERAYIIFFVLLYILAHVLFPIKEMYGWMFKKRWILGGMLLLFITANRYHGDSIEFYNNIVQPGQETMYSKPILGEIRTIRSDEFLVNTPATFASVYGEDSLGKHTNLLRGTDTLNIVAGVEGGYTTLAYAPWELSYLVLPLEYAFSFSWYAPIILAFLMAIEFCYILSQKNRLLSVTGAFLTVFSSFFLWWTFPPFLISAPGTVVCVYHFIKTNSKKKRILYGIGAAVCFANFVILLYPAWQVPLGYMFLVIAIWLIKKNWGDIRLLDKQDWCIFSACAVFMISFLVSYFYSAGEYLQAVTETVYPGARRDTGRMVLQKIFNYVQAPLYAYREPPNASEAGVFLSFFPIPTIMAICYWVRSKKKDFLIGALLLVQIPMLFYVTTGLPEIIAKISLYENAAPERVIDIIALLQIYLLIILLSKKESGMNVVCAGALSAAVACVATVMSSRFQPNYFSSMSKISMLIIIFFLCLGITMKLSKTKRAVVLVSIIVVSIFTGIAIRPISRGLDAIYAKPVAQKIMKISEQNKQAKWIALGGGFALPSYAVSCGASTINSVNFYPNMDLWGSLDPAEKYEEVYNRYAHINLELTNDNTRFEEVQPDLINVDLSYKDIEKTEATYVLALNIEEDELMNEYVKFDKLYEENGASIYQIIYR